MNEIQLRVETDTRGQLVRTAVAHSAAAGTPIGIHNIRTRRIKPTVNALSLSAFEIVRRAIKHVLLGLVCLQRRAAENVHSALS